MTKNEKTPLLARFFASCIDGLIYTNIFLILLYQVAQSANRDDFLNSTLDAILILLVIGPAMQFFQAYLTSYVGGTLGKIISGLQVVGRENGKLISFKRALFRRIVKVLLSAKVLWIGYLWILIHHENLSWHDMAANTRVVAHSKNGWIVGLAMTVTLLVTGAVLAQMAVQGFINNSHVYTNLFLDLRNMF